MNYSVEDLINYRIERAYNSLEEAKILAEPEHWNTVLNRLYYNCFYMILALFAIYNFKVSTHSGVKSQFHKYFIKTGKISQELGAFFSYLSNKRQLADYQDFQSFSKEEIEPLISETANFPEQIRLFISRNK